MVVERMATTSTKPNTRRQTMNSRKMRRIIVLVVPPVGELDFVGPLQSSTPSIA
jgi:hypothetical protein